MSNEQETITNSNESTNTETTEQENQEVQQEAQGQENQVTTEQTKERPEWLDSKFETPEELQNSYNQLQQNFIQGVMKLKKSLLKKLMKKLKRTHQ